MPVFIPKELEREEEENNEEIGIEKRKKRKRHTKFNKTL